MDKNPLHRRLECYSRKNTCLAYVCKALSSSQHHGREVCLRVLEERNALDAECWETILETATTPSVSLFLHHPFSHPHSVPTDFDHFFLSINSTSKEQDITRRKKIKMFSNTLFPRPLGVSKSMIWILYLHIKAKQHINS